jgi:hypothetical protein
MSDQGYFENQKTKKQAPASRCCGQQGAGIQLESARLERGQQASLAV